MTSLTPHQINALDFEKHTSLTANAGSGKTFVLSKRYLEIALSEFQKGGSLRNIAAITFTDKAASELYTEIANQIDQRIKEEIGKDQNEKNRLLIGILESMRRQLVSANISTIHSFCIDILREFPVESKIDANFIPINERLSTELIELSVDETIKESLVKERENSGLKYLIRIFASKTIFTKELTSLIKKKRVNVLSLQDSIYKKDEDEIARYFSDSFLKGLSEIFLNKKDIIMNALSLINNYILHQKYSGKKTQAAAEVDNLIISILNENDIKKTIDLLDETKSQILTKERKFRKDYLSDEDRESFRIETESIENYFNEISKIEIHQDHHELELQLAHFGKTLLIYFNKALAKYEGKKKERGCLDFEDILLLTREVLKNDNVRRLLSEKFKFIMIDEYQDTNEIQYEIFLSILEHLKTGNLFVVGDEKQSIYMFRDADLKVFFQTKRQIEDFSGSASAKILPATFRMAPAICAFTNKLFRNLFSNPDILYNEVHHSEIVCARDDSQTGTVEFLLAEEDKDKIFNYEAELTAKRILKFVNESKTETKVDYKDIAVLCRKRKSFPELEKAFQKYNIPFVIAGGKGFYQRQVIYDFLNYFSFLLDRNNGSALVGILRSPFFSISDKDIFEISLLKGLSYWEKLKKYSLENKKFEEIVSVIEKNLILSKSLDAGEMLRKILNESDLLAALASKPNGKQELANVEKLIRLTIDFSSHDFNTLYDYVNFLNDSIEKTEDEAQAVMSDESDSVNIMTLHQSKGLQFAAVFLYNTHEKSEHDKVNAKKICVDKEFGLLTKLPYKENFFANYVSAPILNISDIISSKKNIAEVKRLLYVGITRAKNHLFISAVQNKTPATSFINLLQEGLEIDFRLNSFRLKDKLGLLKNIQNEFQNIESEIEIGVPVIKHLEEPKLEDKIDKKKAGSQVPDFLLDEIKDYPKGEIISATKAAVFKQCPLKYQLTYEYGFQSLINQYKSWLRDSTSIKKKKNLRNKYEFSEKEEVFTDEGSIENIENSIADFPEIKGRIIHSILQKELTMDEVKKNLEKLINEESDHTDFKNSGAADLKEDILADISKFYASEVFSEVRSHKKFRNEYEIYVKEKDYFLYGIIDKIIFDENKIVIIDYKTDDIKADEVEERSKAYITQLKFYSYIVSRLFPGFKEFELKLIFIKYPEKPIVETMDIVSSAFRQDFREEIDIIVDKIRNKDYARNLSHCGKCTFGLKGRCIKTDI